MTSKIAATRRPQGARRREHADGSGRTRRTVDRRRPPSPRRRVRVAAPAPARRGEAGDGTAACSGRAAHQASSGGPKTEPRPGAAARAGRSLPPPSARTRTAGGRTREPGLAPLLPRRRSGRPRRGGGPVRRRRRVSLPRREDAARRRRSARRSADPDRAHSSAPKAAAWAGWPDRDRRAARRRRPSAAAAIQARAVHAATTRSRTRSYGSGRSSRIRDSRTWDTSFGRARERRRRCRRGGLLGGRNGEELPLDIGLQARRRRDAADRRSECDRSRPSASRSRPVAVKDRARARYVSLAAGTGSGDGTAVTLALASLERGGAEHGQ